MSEDSKRPLYLNVNVHNPEVVAASTLDGMGTTSVTLGRRDDTLDTVHVELFVPTTDVVKFVAELTRTINTVRPNFMWDLVNELYRGNGDPSAVFS